MIGFRFSNGSDMREKRYPAHYQRGKQLTRELRALGVLFMNDSINALRPLRSQGVFHRTSKSTEMGWSDSSKALT